MARTRTGRQDAIVVIAHGARAVTDATGSKIMPKGAISAGFGGTAPRPPASPAPWLMIIAAGTLLTVAALVRLRRPA
jgi:hypothetical protein